MGQITYFNLNNIITHFKCTTYVETGTGIGVSLQYALQHPFEKFYTVDIDKDLQESTKQNINDPRVEYVNGLSTESLKLIVQKLDGVE